MLNSFYCNYFHLLNSDSFFYLYRFKNGKEKTKYKKNFCIQKKNERKTRYLAKTLSFKNSVTSFFLRVTLDFN